MLVICVHFTFILHCLVSYFSLAKFHKLGDKKGPQHYLFQRPFAGAIRQGTLCADSMSELEGGKVGISRCHGRGVNQVSKIFLTSIAQNVCSIHYSLVPFQNLVNFYANSIF